MMKSEHSPGEGEFRPSPATIRLLALLSKSGQTTQRDASGSQVRRHLKTTPPMTVVSKDRSFVP